MSGHAGNPPTLLVLTGCTAAGKTELAIRFALAHDAEILSCDSLLFYRGMDIGTAKPTARELGAVPHHLIDIRDVTEPMNVAEYARLARQAADSIHARGKRVIAVGGSGFYLKTFFAPIADSVEIPEEIRSGVSRLLAEAGLQAAVEELRLLNPGGLGDLDTANPRRVGNALARCLASGRTLAELAEDFSRAPLPFEGWSVRLARAERAPRQLEERIDQRVEAMLKAGLVGEVRRLLAAGLASNPSACRAIGYREVIDVIEGRLPERELAAAISKNTRALVKKQRTWFRTQLPAHPMVEPGDLEGLSSVFLA